MNCGRDYSTARRQAQANADLTHRPWQLHYYGGAWWAQPIHDEARGPVPTYAERIEPRAPFTRSETQEV